MTAMGGTTGRRRRLNRLPATGRTRKLRGSSPKVRLRRAEGTVYVQTAITRFQQRIHCQRG